MRKFLLFAVICYSFSFTVRKTYVPPGTVQITESFFADECEVSNLSWIEFQYWTAVTYGKNSKQHLFTLPDTLVWRDKDAYNEPYVQYYHRHLAYRNYPVVGITHEQALAFCKWRTERVKSFFYLRYKKDININYRLPTKQEWELLATIGPDVFSNRGKNGKEQLLLNCALENDTIEATGYSSSNADVTAPVNSFWKNRFGLFNLAGNVAEMVEQNGICKGGSWRHKIKECRFGKDITYTKAEAWLGFRCVCDFNKN